MTIKKILIIEDEQALADVLEAKIKKEGYAVSVAYDGEKGFELLKKNRPDLILLDIVMPKMNGYEVMEKMASEGISIPIMVISNSGQPVEIEKTKKLGAIAHLIKTQFDPNEVILKIKKIESGKPLREEVLEVIDSSEGARADNGIKVLLVEDDRFLREICSKKLIKEGFRVFEAADGEQALKDIEKVAPEIVLLDIILPAIDGFQVLAQVRASKSKKIAKVPIIMLSNLGQEDDIKKALKFGANDYLIKAHFTTEEIVDKIRKTLKVNK